MTIQQFTNKLSSGSQSNTTQAPSDLGHGLPDIHVLTQLANEFFTALPSTSSTVADSPIEPSNLNLSLPPHPLQPAEPLAALSARAPNIAFQKGLHPEISDHVPNLPDHPERRAVASAPIVGGANLPKAPFEARAAKYASSPFDVTHVATSNSTVATAPFYFLDHVQSQPDSVVVPSSDSHNSHLATTAANQNEYIAQEDLSLILPAHSQQYNLADTHPAFYFLDHVPTTSSQAESNSTTSQLPNFASKPSFDVTVIRRDFPILQERINGHPLIWFDNAATTQKPQSVLDRITYFYQHENSNIHRAAHSLAARATDAYEHARKVVARFIGAPSAKDIIFVRGTTEGINLIAKTWGEQNIGAGDEIIVSQLEHHANIVPWYQLSQKTGAKLRVIPVDDHGQIIITELAKLISARTKLITITQVSNALGTVTPVAEVIHLAHAHGVKVLVDGAQSVSHMPTNVQALDADFFVFSGHKVFGPTGIGAVYAKAEILESMPVWEGGGNMIQDVTFEQVIYQEAPNKFEAGTGNIADAVGLGAALEYVESIGIQHIAAYEHSLLEYGQHALKSISGLRLIGTALHKASVMSFVLDGYATEEVGKAFNQQGIAVRSGHHCAQPILRRFGVEQTVRPSIAFYNTFEEIDIMIQALQQLTGKKRIYSR